MRSDALERSDAWKDRAFKDRLRTERALDEGARIRNWGMKQLEDKLSKKLLTEEINKRGVEGIKDVSLKVLATGTVTGLGSLIISKAENIPLQSINGSLLFAGSLFTFATVATVAVVGIEKFTTYIIDQSKKRIEQMKNEIDEIRHFKNFSNKWRKKAEENAGSVEKVQ